jgi:hypothetical protein
MFQLRRPRRPRRSGEWTESKTVTFIVTLAASRSVTLAARQAGMSRKAAYALKARDPAFAAAWNEAMKAGNAARRKGYEVDETEYPRVSPNQGNVTLRRRRRSRHPGGDPESMVERRESKRSALSDSDFRQDDEYMRDLFFAQLAHIAARQ